VTRLALETVAPSAADRTWDVPGQDPVLRCRRTAALSDASSGHARGVRSPSNERVAGPKWPKEITTAGVALTLRPASEALRVSNQRDPSTRTRENDQGVHGCDGARQASLSPASNTKQEVNMSTTHRHLGDLLHHSGAEAPGNSASSDAKVDMNFE